MSDLQKEAEHWREKLTEDINAIYEVKDNALSHRWGADTQWHEKLSKVTADLRLLSAWLGHLTPQAN